MPCSERVLTESGEEALVEMVSGVYAIPYASEGGDIGGDVWSDLSRGMTGKL